MIDRKKQLNLLGLALRASFLIHGDESVEKAVKRKKVRCIIIANDISQATMERYQRFSQTYDVPLINRFNRLEISQAIGKSRSICGITDKGLSDKFLSYETGEEYI